MPPSLSTTLEVNKGFQFFDGLSTNCDWLFDSGVRCFCLNSIPADVVTRWFFFHFSCIWQGFWEKRVRSFVNSTLPSCVSSVHCIPLFLPDVVVFIILSVTKRERERIGDSKHPWQIPILTSKLSDVWLAREPYSIAWVCITNRGNELLGTSIVPQYLQQSRNVVKCGLVVIEVDIIGEGWSTRVIVQWWNTDWLSGQHLIFASKTCY